MTPQLSSQQQDGLERLFDGTEPFAVARGQRHSELGRRVHIFHGRASFHDLLNDIPQTHEKSDGQIIDTVSAVPFNQIRERGFSARSAGERISTLSVDARSMISRQVALDLFPAETIAVSGDITHTFSMPEYADVVRRVQRDEIGRGEGSNFVVADAARFAVEDMSRAKALSIFRKLLETEFGSYMHFLYYDGERYLVGASPERHLTVSNGHVTMNPISGTFRKEGRTLLKQFRSDLMKFLGDKKETMELCRVLDEELKMMSDMCDEGGTVVGPLLKEMLRLIHTEYELIGYSRSRAIDLFRMSMFAPTVIGGPLGNACDIIQKYEPESRGYYGGALMMLGRDYAGRELLDSAIAIRMAEITPEGTVTVRAGSTIVHNSDPDSEAREKQAKMSGILGAFRDTHKRSSVSVPAMPQFDDEINEALERRNDTLSSFALHDQHAEMLAVSELVNKKITVIDNGDDFCKTLRHMIVRMGANVHVVPFFKFDSSSDDSDIVIVGPGPGDPNDEQHPKMVALSGIVRDLRTKRKPMLGVCLGHQMIARDLGLSVRKMDTPLQGVQKQIDYFGTETNAGFYNTFAAESKHLDGVEISSDENTRDVFAMRGEKFASVQFHPESVLSQDGLKILRDALIRLTQAEIPHSEKIS